MRVFGFGEVAEFKPSRSKFWEHVRMFAVEPIDIVSLRVAGSELTVSD